MYVEDTCNVADVCMRGYKKKQHHVFSNILSQISDLCVWNTGCIAWGFGLLCVTDIVMQEFDKYWQFHNGNQSLNLIIKWYSL